MKLSGTNVTTRRSLPNKFTKELQKQLKKLSKQVRFLLLKFNKNRHIITIKFKMFL